MKNFIKQHRNLFNLTTIITSSVLLIIILATILAPVIAPYDSQKMDLGNVLKGFSFKHLLGTDKAGRDIFSRLLFGGRTTLLSGLTVVGISILVGIPIGLGTGYYGGKFDWIIMKIWSIIMSFPAILLAFVLMMIVGKGILPGIIALGIVYIPMISRLTRSLTLMEKNKTYVEAAKVLGFSDKRILFIHILPNCLSTIFAELTLDLAFAILDLAGLSFLGLGVQPPQSDWGFMLADGQKFLTTQPLLAIILGVCIMIVVISLNLLSMEVLAYVDPKQRKFTSFAKLKNLSAKKSGKLEIVKAVAANE